MSLRNNVKAVGLTLGVWAIVFVGINFICGLIVQNRYIAVDPINKKTALKSWGYFEPNQQKRILFPGLKEYQVTINPLGFRSVGDDRNISSTDLEGKYRILALGDSMTFGLFVNDEDSYPFRLQQIFKSYHEPVIVLNAGVGSTTITDFLYYLKVKGLQLKPNLVTISFCENDLVEFRDPPLYERIQAENVTSFFKSVKLMKVMRVFRKLELAYRYRRSTRKIADARVKAILLNESKNLDDILYVAAYQSGKQLSDPGSEDLRGAWQKYFAALDETIALLKRERVNLLYVLYPHISTVFEQVAQDYQDILIAHLKEQGVDYVDLRPAFKSRKGQYLELYNNLPRDFHLSGKGNQIVAEAIYEKIKGQNDFREIEIAKNE
jgi:lysophospholipase L1-like esterase